MDIEYCRSESTVKPDTVEIGKNVVFLRKNFSKEIRTDDLGNQIVFWTYQEAKMPQAEFTTYASLLNSRDIVDNVNSNNQLIIMDAIADLYDIISHMSGGISL